MIATAGLFLTANAFLIISSCPEKSNPCRNFPTFPITPLNLMCGIIFFFFEKRKHINAY